jgi:hypothetical protein
MTALAAHLGEMSLAGHSMNAPPSVSPISRRVHLHGEVFRRYPRNTGSSAPSGYRLDSRLWGCLCCLVDGGLGFARTDRGRGR